MQLQSSLSPREKNSELNYDTDSCTCGCADESRDEAPKDRSRGKKKNY